MGKNDHSVHFNPSGFPGFFVHMPDGVIKMNGVPGNDHDCAHALPSFPNCGSG